LARRLRSAGVRRLFAVGQGAAKRPAAPGGVALMNRDAAR